MAQIFDGVEVSRHVENKINGLHHVSIDEVFEAIEHMTSSRWGMNGRGVERLLCLGATDAGRRLAFVLYPVPGMPNEWRLATAYPEPPG